ncbi:glycan biosynthesis hexose transferase WsfD [Paenibacillus sp. MMO-177]|uniref:glycan biosynthesis hexose transferase WsfD n=1 Tax=Paenibacillus sp. MMO-177 TaxID=3081289 RepID=UPI003018749A
MLKSSMIRNSVLYIFIVIVISILIYVPATIGLADNSDFNRTMRAFGLSSISGIKYWSADYLYQLSSPVSVFQYFKNIFLPVRDNPAEYYSTQFLFTKIALFFNSLASKLFHRAPNLFHLFFQTVQYILIYAFAFFLFLKEKWKDNAYADIAVKAIFALIFLDCGYLVYFNSFYGESTTLIFLILSFALLLHLEKNKNSYWVYIGLILSLFIFSGSKSANFPSTLLLCVPLVYYVIKHEGLKKKIAVCVLVIGMLIASYSYVKLTPQWMKNDTSFQSVFFGVLYNNPSPEKAIQDLGLPRELSGFESMNAYNRQSLHPEKNDIDFQTLFFSRISQLEVLKYYFTHPAFFAEKLDISAEAALPLRPTYLTNIHLSSQQADLLFDDRMNVWESIRKRFSGSASLFLGLILVLSAANVVALLRRKASIYSILLRLALMGAAAGQFIVPIVSNGNADLQKHMFLLNVHLDILIIVLLLDNLDFKSRTFWRVGIVTAAFLIVISFYSSRPEMLTLGRIAGKPIQWYVLEKNDGWAKVIAKDALFRSAYDETSNDYTKASIHESLNAVYINEWFTHDERNRIGYAEYYAICGHNNPQQAEAGDRPHYFFSPIKYAAQNSDRAFRQTYSAYLTLPSVDDVKQLFDLSKTASVLPVDYWLSTPYYGSTNKSRIVSSDYQVYHRKVDKELGIRPVMWVRL